MNTGPEGLIKRLNTNSCTRAVEDVKNSSGAELKSRWNKPGVCGLDNSGNSCYLNAVLQCLCSTVPLVEHLLNQDARKEFAKCRCRVAEVFARLLEKMWLGSSSICAPAETRSVLCSIFPQFNNFSQQDAQELLLYLLNALHDDLKKVAKRQTHFLKQPRKEPNRNIDAEPTIVSHLFEGQLSYTTICMHCDHQAHNTQSFTILSLPLPKDTSKCSIQDCLSLFFEETLLTGSEQMLCSECGLRRETTVLTRLEKPPEILLLHLKRFGRKGKNQVKLRTNVLFSMKLDLSAFLSCSEQNASAYHLYAVVVSICGAVAGFLFGICSQIIRSSCLEKFRTTLTLLECKLCLLGFYSFQEPHGSSEHGSLHRCVLQWPNPIVALL
nr:putative ubiquitin carboxyl-terminal hydrolase 50 isoform X1 [Nothobranchius furzeri]